MGLAILMASYNEGERLLETLASVALWARDHEAVSVFLVDDGSATPLRIEIIRALSIAGVFRVIYTRHAINLGQGAALETARSLALAASADAACEFAADVFVTMDADGQHSPTDLAAFTIAIRAGADVALGERSQSLSIPWHRKALLFAARVFESWLVGRSMKDAHNGFRGFSRHALAQIAIRQNRMAHATEIAVQVAARKLTIVEVPVCVRYTEETLAKGQRSSDALLVLRDLLVVYLFSPHPTKRDARAS